MTGSNSIARDVEVASGRVYLADGQPGTIQILEVNEVTTPPETCKVFPSSGPTRRLRCAD